MVTNHKLSRHSSAIHLKQPNPVSLSCNHITTEIRLSKKVEGEVKKCLSSCSGVISLISFDAQEGFDDDLRFVQLLRNSRMDHSK